MVRLVACLIQLAFADRKLPAGWTKVSVQPQLLKTLLSQGIWMTASNLIGPLVQKLDRFIIAGLATAAVVAYYTVPSEMMLRLLIIPGDLASALFPKLRSEERSVGKECVSTCRSRRSTDDEKKTNSNDIHITI